MVKNIKKSGVFLLLLAVILAVVVLFLPIFAAADSEQEPPITQKDFNVETSVSVSNYLSEGNYVDVSYVGSEQEYIFTLYEKVGNQPPTELGIFYPGEVFHYEVGISDLTTVSLSCEAKKPGMAVEDAIFVTLLSFKIANFYNPSSTVAQILDKAHIYVGSLPNLPFGKMDVAAVLLLLFVLLFSIRYVIGIFTGSLAGDYALSFISLLAVCSLVGVVSYYLKINSFVIIRIVWLLLVVTAISKKIIRLVRNRHSSYSNMEKNKQSEASPSAQQRIVSIINKEYVKEIATLAFPLAFFGSLSLFSGIWFGYGTDNSDYTARTRLLLQEGQFFAKQLGSPYVLDAPDATYSIYNALQASIADITGVDTLAVVWIFNIIGALALVSGLYFLLRSFKVPRPLCVPSIFLVAFLQMIWPINDPMSYGFQRNMLFYLAYALLGFLIWCFRQKPIQKKHLFFFIICLASLAGIHLPRYFASSYAMIILLTGLVFFFYKADETVYKNRLKEQFVLLVQLALVFIGASVFFILPKLTSTLSISTNSAYDGISSATVYMNIKLFTLLTASMFCAGIVFLSYRKSNRYIMPAHFEKISVVSFLMMLLAYLSVYLMGFLSLPLHQRNFYEITFFLEPVILVFVVLGVIAALYSIIKNRKKGILPAVAFGLVVVVFWNPGMLVYKKCTHKNILNQSSVVQVKEYDFISWQMGISQFINDTLEQPPRVAGNPDSLQLLAVTANVQPTFYRVRHASFMHRAQLGYFPAYESLYVGSATTREEAAIWGDRLQADYYYICKGYGKYDAWGKVAFEKTFWATDEGRACVVYEDALNVLYAIPPLTPAMEERSITSRLLRLNILQASSLQEKTPMVTKIMYGDSEIPMASGIQDGGNFLYTTGPPYTVWGELEKAGIYEGRRIGLVSQRTYFDSVFRISQTGEDALDLLNISFFDDVEAQVSIELWDGTHWILLENVDLTASNELIQVACNISDVPVSGKAGQFIDIKE